MQPEDGRGIAGDVSALATALMMPRMLKGNLLFPAVLGVNFTVWFRHTLNDQLTLGFELEEKLMCVILFDILCRALPLALVCGKNGNLYFNRHHSLLRY